MARLDTLEDMVRDILKANARARDDDRELSLQVWVQHFGKNPYAPMIDIMHDKSLPSQESIGRVRRQIQRYDESLRGSKRRERERLKAQADYLEYNEGSN